MSESTETVMQEENPTTFDYRYVVSVRFRNSRKAYTFGTNDETIEYGDYVVVETIRGMEMGEIISSLRDRQLDTQNVPLKPVLRKATRRDRENYAQNRELAKSAIVQCQQAIQRLNLQMNLISCEYTLDRSKIIFIYVADERVDFRELLKELAAMFKCRIELRQIGPRDKAKIIGGLGTCGMETCCSRFMEDFDVVSINMAKNQLLALNIQKLSGQCGKLMCCLKFEDENYKQLRAGLPKLNAQVEYEGVMYRVTSMNVISGTAKIENRETAQFITLKDLAEKGVFRRPDQKAAPAQPKEKPAAEKKAPEKKSAEKAEKKEKETRSPDRKKPERRAQHGEQNSEKKQKNRQRPEKKRPVDNPDAQQKETKNQEKSRSAHRRRRRRPSKEAGKPTGENQ